MSLDWYPKLLAVPCASQNMVSILGTEKLSALNKAECFYWNLWSDKALRNVLPLWLLLLSSTHPHPLKALQRPCAESARGDSSLLLPPAYSMHILPPFIYSQVNYLSRHHLFLPVHTLFCLFPSAQKHWTATRPWPSSGLSWFSQ